MPKTEREREYNRKWSKEVRNPRRVEGIKNLEDWYVKYCLAKETKIPARNLTQEMIELKRLELQLRRVYLENVDKETRDKYRQQKDNRVYARTHKAKLSETRRRYYQANKQKIAEKNKAYREANKERRRAQIKRWQQLNRERVNEWQRNYRNSEKGLAYKEANREKKNAYGRAYYAANKEQIAVKKKAKYQAKKLLTKQKEIENEKRK